eukprot:6787013-Pyramimonas_sp.AAC.1
MVASVGSVGSVANDGRLEMFDTSIYIHLFIFVIGQGKGCIDGSSGAGVERGSAGTWALFGLVTWCRHR